jgi:nitroreductase
MIEDLIRRNRSCRRFYQDSAIDRNTLEGLVNLARLSASAGNLQPLKYILCNDPVKNAEIFKCLAWAAYLKDWNGPGDGERPAAYIVVLGDTHITKDVGCDHGIASQSICLGARNMGLSSCIIGSIKKQRLRKLLDIPVHLKTQLVIALGKPREVAVIETVEADGDIRYWRDEKGVHHVPKRKLTDVIVNCFS